ncbi:MAG: orotidine 5'-phosphate decarboxylase / HUMPS family protein, partial [Patescibacteria group bacterium]
MGVLQNFVEQVAAAARESSQAEERSDQNQTVRLVKPLHKNSRLRLNRRTHYLQVALNRTLADAARIISTLPISDRIILEAGTPLIKSEGMQAVRAISNWGSAHFGRPVYVVADLKTMDRGATEVDLATDAGASGVVALGAAPIETLNQFVARCAERGVDSLLDMMNIEFPIEVLAQLKKRPDVVILHRGVDETAFNKEKPIPYAAI